MDRGWQQWQRTSWTRGFFSLLLVGILIAAALQSCVPTWFRTDVSQVPRLVTSELNDPVTFNPVTSPDPHAVLGLMYEGMITQDGETGELGPGIAESWQISNDQRHIVLTLRQDVRWSDGQPLTADDVVFSFNEIYLNPNIPNSKRDILQLGEAELFPQVQKLSDYQVEFITPAPFAPFLRYIGTIPLLPKHALAASVHTTDAAGNPKFLASWGTATPLSEIITNGPYRLLSYRPGERIILERNPYYWRKDDQGNAQPYIDRIVIPIVGSTDNALMQFRSGALDVVNLPADFFTLMKREEKRGKFTVYNAGPTPAVPFVMFNLNQSTRQGKPLVDPIKSRWFNTLEFRQAVAYAINRPALLNTTFQGLGELYNSSIYRQSPYYLSPAAGLPVYNYDPDRARELLKQGGFQYSPQGQLADADGNPVRFTLLTSADNRIRRAIAVQVQQDLAQVGITVDLQLLDISALVAKLLGTLDWEAHISHFVGGGVEPDSARNIWSVQGTFHIFNQDAAHGDPLQGRIIQDWEQKISDLYVAGSQELDEAKRRAIYAQIQILAQNYLPVIYLIAPFAFSAIRNDIENVRFSGASWRLWNVYELKLKQSS